MAKPARNGRGLTAKQEKAVQHYILHGNMTAAYRHAYDCGRMKAATIKRRAFELFNTPHIAARVEELREENHRISQLRREEALAILARIARGELSRYLDEEGRIRPELVQQGGPEIESYTEKQHVQSGDGDTIVLSRKLKLRDPIRAIKRIGHMCGWANQGPLDAERVTITLNMGEPDE